MEMFPHVCISIDSRGDLTWKFHFQSQKTLASAHKIKFIVTSRLKTNFLSPLSKRFSGAFKNKINIAPYTLVPIELFLFLTSIILKMSSSKLEATRKRERSQELNFK
jgi:hypothetical protein